MTKKSVAFRITRRLIADISDRKGLGDEWDRIQTDVKEEIERTWQQIIEDMLANER